MLITQRLGVQFPLTISQTLQRFSKKIEKEREGEGERECARREGESGDVEVVYGVGDCTTVGDVEVFKLLIQP